MKILGMIALSCVLGCQAAAWGAYPPSQNIQIKATSGYIDVLTVGGSSQYVTINPNPMTAQKQKEFDVHVANNLPANVCQSAYIYLTVQEGEKKPLCQVVFHSMPCVTWSKQKTLWYRNCTNLSFSS